MRGAAGCVDSRATSAALGEQVESAVPREDRERVCSLSLPTCCIYVLATCTPVLSLALPRKSEAEDMVVLQP